MARNLGDDIDSAVQAQISSLMSSYVKTADLPSGVQFVNQQSGGAIVPLTIADLMANYPASASLKGRYAQVSDLWGAGIFGVMRCGYNQRIYYWEPTTQPQLIGQMPATTSTTIQPLSSFPIIELTGTIPLGNTVNVTAGLDYAWPGAIKEFRGSMTSLLGSLNILGSGIGSTLAMALGGNRRIGCYDNGSALVWRQLN